MANHRQAFVLVKSMPRMTVDVVQDEGGMWLATVLAKPGVLFYEADLATVIVKSFELLTTIEYGEPSQIVSIRHDR